MITAPYSSSVSGGRDGFDRLLLAEWTKLRSVPRWGLTMLAAIVLTVLVALLVAAGSGSEDVGGAGGSQSVKPFRDAGHLVHRPLAGDGSLVARVATQASSHQEAKAGLILRESTRPGSPYAAVMVTPGRGVRLQSDFTTDVAGSAGTAPRWLKLTRSGDSVTGYESADGAAWSRVGTVRLDELPQRVEVGLFVASPNAIKINRQFGSESIDERPTDGKATFERVSLEPAQPQQSVPWRDHDGSSTNGKGGSSRAGDTFTVTGSGDIGPYELGEDVTKTTLSGVLIGLTAIVALAVLFITSEYKRGTIWMTFAACPRRGRVLAAKSVVIGAVTFVAGLVAAFGAILLAQPILRSNDKTPASLTEGPVLRAVVGTAALLAVIAIFSLAVATILRRSAAAITVVLMLLLIPYILATGLPLSASLWLGRLTPAAGFAIQETMERYDTAIGPWAGFGVLCGYTAITLAIAFWLLRRRDA